ncbi:MAG: DEAD/DEAH box helicase [Gammaproteobacteria bacterium]|nr:DEAD/DEAH box helicase [Gammaproteobacteria bacterium]
MLSFIKNLFARLTRSSSEPAHETRTAQHKEHGDDAGKKRRRNRNNRKRGERTERSEAVSAPVIDNWTLDDFPVPVAEGKTRFHDLDLPLALVHSIADLGFQYASPIQAEILPATLAGRDAVGQAQTGTGKTAAFLITIIDRILRTEGEPRPAGQPLALVLAPTRELVIQIGKDSLGLNKHTGLRTITLVGGMDYQKQQRELDQGQVDIIVATPGRLIDFCEQNLVDLSKVQILVIDEADRMLDMGFVPQMRRIVRRTPYKGERQTQLFSATFPRQVREMIENWCVNPIEVTINPEHVATATVEQRMYMVTTDKKYDVLYNLIQNEDLQRVMIFANRRDETRRLADRLKAHGISSALLSGDVEQSKRVKTLEAFREGQIRVLVATDVAGRGIHVDGVSHVINFTLPDDPEDYVHRIGRTGRAGATGTSISFASEDDAFAMLKIEELMGEKPNYLYPEDTLMTKAPYVEMPREERRPHGGGGRGGPRSGGGHSGGRGGPRRH